MSQDINFKPLFDFIDEKFVGVDERFDVLEQGQRALQISVDNLAKMVKDFRDEHIVMHRRLELLETWAKKVSAKVGVPLPE